MEHLAELAPLVQILDAPVPQTVDQLLDIEQFFRALSPVPKQVIEVPNILLDDVPVRTAVRVPQLAEQGSADDRFLFFLAADYGAARRHSSSRS